MSPVYVRIYLAHAVQTGQGNVRVWVKIKIRRKLVYITFVAQNVTVSLPLFLQLFGMLSFLDIDISAILWVNLKRCTERTFLSVAKRYASFRVKRFRDVKHI